MNNDRKLIIPGTDIMFNISTIDEQHYKFIRIFNSIVKLTTIRKEVTDENVSQILDELSAYLRYHFNTEEKLMTLAEYHELDKHFKEHLMFIEKIDEFLQGFKYKNPVLLDDMLMFTKTWFITHIMQTDAKYVETLNAYFKKNSNS